MHVIKVLGRNGAAVKQEFVKNISYSRPRQVIKLPSVTFVSLNCQAAAKLPLIESL